ncbi:MAG: hypothetical protein IT573_10230 [Deltaproteobacteria bacterium]|nr:hypothetical protein [Deltaproteobacteria bacterium]
MTLRLFPILMALFLHPASTLAASLPDSLPPLERLEQAALARAGLDPAKIGRWERNARRAVALPRLQVGYEQKAQNNNTAVIQDSISVTASGITIGPESNRVDQDFGNDRGFEVKAVWALDELLFNRDELEISRESRDLYLLRGRLQEDLHQAYFELKSQLLRFELEPETAQDPFERLKAHQWMERLNSLSGGEFFRLAKISLPSPRFAESQPESLPEENHGRRKKFHAPKNSAPLPASNGPAPGDGMRGAVAP